MKSSSFRFPLGAAAIALGLTCSPLVGTALAQAAEAQAPRLERPAPVTAHGRPVDPRRADADSREASAVGRPGPEARSVPDAQRELPGGVSGASRFPDAAPRESRRTRRITSKASGSAPNDDYQRNDKLELAAAVLAGFAAFTAAGHRAVARVVWLIRTVLEQRRWSRLSKIQAEVHSKLMDRFSSNDELITYVQTPSGRRFLESGPSPLQQDTAPAMARADLADPVVAAARRRAARRRPRAAVPERAGVVRNRRRFFYVAGCMATAVGAGFLVSAVAAYVLSRRLGLLDRPDGTLCRGGRQCVT